MTQEEKELLLKDLCARLPYKVKCHYNCVTSYDTMVISKANAEGELKGIIPLSNGHIGYMIDCDKINALEGDIKPYLRPMSSITKDEKEEIKPLFSKVIDEFGKRMLVVRQNKMVLYQDWLNAHYFDYRGLIDKGLAIEAPKGMYNIETE